MSSMIYRWPFLYSDKPGSWYGNGLYYAVNYGLRKKILLKLKEKHFFLYVKGFLIWCTNTYLGVIKGRDNRYLTVLTD